MKWYDPRLLKSRVVQGIAAELSLTAAIGVVHRFFRGRHQARGQAIYGRLAYGVGGAIGSLASGYAWDALGAGLTFSAASACALAGMLLIVWKLKLKGSD